MNEAKIAEAYACIQALRANLDKEYAVEQKYVEEYHFALDKLAEASGKNLSSFRIPASELRRRVVHSNSVSGVTDYSKFPECDGAFFRVKLDTLLILFDIRTKGKTIGFTG